MTNTSLLIAQAYYTAMGEKNIVKMETYLHPEVQLLTPLVDLKGKEAVIEAIKKVLPAFSKLIIRTTFEATDQAMVVYDFDFPAPIHHCPTAALLTFQKEQIIKIELFFDARPFV